jgi:hypothetical protein
MLLAVPAARQRRSLFQANPRILLGESQDDGIGAVGRAVIHDDDLEADAGRRKRGPHRVADGMRLVPRRDQDRDGGEIDGSQGRRGVDAKIGQKHQCRRHRAEDRGSGERERREHSVGFLVQRIC